MRDSLDVHDSSAFEVAPLIPDPPVKRRRRYNRHQGVCHRCWNVFSYCSRWTCIFISLAVIVLIIILCRSLLPFGWPSWIPALNYDVSDPHIVLIISDDLGWNDVGYGKIVNNNLNDNTDDDNTKSKYFKKFTQLLELEEKKRINSLSKTINDNNNNNDDDSDSTTSINYENYESLFNDGETFRTPNIDTLALTGIILDRFYVSQEGASTRASILTGKNGYRLGLQNGIRTGSSAHIPKHVNLVSELLSNKGYATHLVGKWNLGYAHWAFTPVFRGFDSFIGFMQQFSDYWHYTASEDSTAYENRVGWDLWNGKNVYELAIKDRIVSTELFTSRIENIITDHANGDYPDRPLFLMYGAPNPHTPLDYHSKYSEHCSSMSETLREKYCNVVENFDDSVGIIVNSLKDNNMYERSLIIVLSDNGGMICYDVGDSTTCSGASNYPLRAGKGTLFEGGVRTRALISGGIIPESRYGAIYTNLMMHVDIFSTILGAANVDRSINNNNKNNDDNNKDDGINHFDFLCLTNDETTNSESEFEERTDGILDLLMDDDGNLIRGAYIDYPYKYIIEVDSPYDGWYTSPFDYDDIPEEAQAMKGQYTSEHAGTVSMVDDYEDYFDLMQNNNNNNNIQANTETEGKTNSLQFGTFETTDSGDFAMIYNEYLFNINDDETEQYNLFETQSEIISEMRQKLQDEMNSDLYRTPQDSTSQNEACPSLFDNVWYPFNEK